MKEENIIRLHKGVDVVRIYVDTDLRKNIAKKVYLDITNKNTSPRENNLFVFLREEVEKRVDQIIQHNKDEIYKDKFDSYAEEVYLLKEKVKAIEKSYEYLTEELKNNNDYSKEK